MKIAICDDDQRDIEHLWASVRSHSDEHEIIAFLSARPLLKRIYDGERFDFLFLDVQMPDSDGWEIARELKRARHKIFIAMVTVHGEYIFDCFDRVDWFAQKPVPQERVWKILGSAEERLFPRVLEFQTDKMRVALTAPEVMYFEVKRNTLFVHSTTGLLEVRMSLKKVKELLSTYPQFVQIHSSFIINLDHYNAMKGSYIILKNQEEIKISRTYRIPFLDALGAYVRSGA